LTCETQRANDQRGKGPEGGVGLGAYFVGGVGKKIGGNLPKDPPQT